MKNNGILLIFIMLPIAIGCEKQVKVTPSDNVTTEGYSVRGYTMLDVSDAFDVRVEFADVGESVIIEANENLHPYIRVYMADNLLQIGLNENLSFNGKATLKAYIKIGALESFTASGASVIQVLDPITQERIDIILSGASYFSGMINSEEISAELSGASHLNASGSSVDYSVNASGASVMKDYSLSVDFLNADLSGASIVYTTVNKEIEVEASGGSILNYKGEATIVYQELSGGSMVIKTD